MTNGFAAAQQTLCQGFSGINQAINTNGYETRLGINNLNASLANCCCDIRQQISDCCCQTQTGAQWCEEYGIIYTTFLDRLKRGWTVEQALTISTKGTNRKVNI